MVYGLIHFIIMVVVATLIGFACILGIGFIVGTPAFWKPVAYVVIIVVWLIYRVVR